MEIAGLIEIIKQVLIGLGVGLLIGLTGIGAGAVLQPILIQWLGVPPVQAVGTGFLCSLLSKGWGTIAHIRLNHFRPRRAFVFLLGSIPGVIMASFWINQLVKSVPAERVNNYLKIGIATLLLALAAIILIQELFLRQRLERNQALYYKGGPFPLRKKITGFIAGLIVGVLIGLTSVGGGVLIIPVFILLLDAKAQEAVGSSIVIMLILSALGSFVFLLEGNVYLMTVLGLCLGSIPGVLIGSKLSAHVPERLLRIILIVILVLGGISLI